MVSVLALIGPSSTTLLQQLSSTAALLLLWPPEVLVDGHRSAADARGEPWPPTHEYDARMSGARRVKRPPLRL